jgi:hypothetical protein
MTFTRKMLFCFGVDSSEPTMSCTITVTKRTSVVFEE